MIRRQHRGGDVARAQGRAEGLRRELGAAEGAVDALAGERVVVAGRVAHQQRAVRHGGARGAVERARRQHVVHALGVRQPVPAQRRVEVGRRVAVHLRRLRAGEARRSRSPARRRPPPRPRSRGRARAAPRIRAARPARARAPSAPACAGRGRPREQPQPPQHDGAQPVRAHHDPRPDLLPPPATTPRTRPSASRSRSRHLHARAHLHAARRARGPAAARPAGSRGMPRPRTPPGSGP